MRPFLLGCQVETRIKIDLAMDRCFLVVSGLPASGKSTLARQLSAALSLPLLDKDDILERLFQSRGVGDADWRRMLSRESDGILQAEATASNGAVLVSHWHLRGMPPHSGTPTEWLGELSPGIVNVHCDCGLQLAAERFLQRKRHPGHLDTAKSPLEIRTAIERLAGLGRLGIQPTVDVDTSRAIVLDDVLRDVLHALETSPISRASRDPRDGSWRGRLRWRCRRAASARQNRRRSDEPC
jgi:gluconate kinase